LLSTDAAKAQRWREALAALEREAADGLVLAREQLRVLAGRAPADLLEPPPAQLTSDKAAVYVCRDFAPPGFSEWFIERARDGLIPSVVNDAATGEARLHPMRTALVCGLGGERYDVLTAIMQERAARLSKIPVAGHEAPNVISYEVGQHFSYHVDYVDPAAPGFQQELRTLGQRVVTIVTYLNDEFEGAPTDFPLLNIAFRGKPGEAIAFSNVRADGAPEPLTQHAGLPPTKGRKWVLSQWLRNKPLPRR
jgi:prolyl 4-hydroxylase